MKVWTEVAFTCHECGYMMTVWKRPDGIAVVEHPVVSCSASGQQFERPTIELKAVEANGL